MNRLIAYFIKYPIWANALIVITAIAGILSLFLMPKSFFPEMKPNRVYVNVAYPGASPKEIEEGITTRIEESLNGIQGVKEITSKSSENISSITITGVEGIDVDKMLQDVKNSVDGITQFCWSRRTYCFCTDIKRNGRIKQCRWFLFVVCILMIFGR